MSMEFWIQASDPQYTANYSAADTSLSDALETVFLLETEDAFVVWKHRFIPLGYKYGFSCIIDDLIKLIGAMLAENTGQMVVEWPCNTFNAKWNVTWTTEDVRVESNWISVSGGLTESLNQAGSISLKKSAFLAEWKMPFDKILAALTASGYNRTNFGEIANLESIVRALPERGYLYHERLES
jgi:hypothetical protein